MPAITDRLAYWVIQYEKPRLFYNIIAFTQFLLYTGFFIYDLTWRTDVKGLVQDFCIILYVLILILIKLYCCYYLQNYKRVFEMAEEIEEVNEYVDRNFADLENAFVYYSPYRLETTSQQVGDMLLSKILVYLHVNHLPFILIYVFLLGLIVEVVGDLFTVRWGGMESYFAVLHTQQLLIMLYIDRSDMASIFRGLKLKYKEYRKVRDEWKALLQQTCVICKLNKASDMLKCPEPHYYHTECLTDEMTESQQCSICNGLLVKVNQ